MAVTVVSRTGVPTAQVISTRPSPAYQAASAQLVITAPVVVTVGDQLFGTGTVGLSAGGTAKKVAVVGGTAALGLGSRVGSGRQAGQAGRVSVGLAGRTTQVATSVSGSFTHVTITRDYDLATGEAPIGVVYFTPSAWLKNNGVTLVAAPVGAALNSLGQISISLAANTDPATTPPNSYYVVREAIVGQLDRSYKVAIPYNAGLTIDLATLTVIP